VISGLARDPVASVLRELSAYAALEA